MKALFKRGIHSYEGLVLAALIVCLALHAFTLATMYKSPPSEGFSREVKIGEVAYGNSKFNTSQIITTLSIDEESVSVVAIDGTESKVYSVNPKGKILNESIVDLDLSKATKMSAYFLDESHLRVFYSKDTLQGSVIDIQKGTFSTTQYAKDIKSFENKGAQVILLKEDGLYGLNLEAPDSAEKKIIEGEIDSFSLEEKDDLFYLTYVERNETDFVSGQLLILDRDYEVLANYNLFLNKDKQLIGDIKDIYFKEGILSNIFVWGDRKSKKSKITTLQVETGTGEILHQFKNSFELSLDKIQIVQTTKGSVSLIMPDYAINGINIVYNTLENEKEILTLPLSKTRGVSTLPSYHETQGKKILIFSDLNKGARAIYMASNDVELISETTSFKTINFFQVIGTSIFVFVVALFIALIVCILLFEPIPILSLVLLYQFTKGYKFKRRLEMGVAAALHTLVKIFVVHKILSERPEIYTIQSKIIGAGVPVYVVLVITSIFSLFCTQRFARQSEDYDNSSNFTFFALLDIALFGFTFIAYILTSLLFNKV